MEKLEPLFGIRVSAVAPGVVRTPLWLDHPVKSRMVVEGKDEWIMPEEVADAMLTLIEQPNLVGGTILEVGKGQRRIVHMLNDKGPSGAGHTVSNGDVLDEKAIAVLKAELEKS